MKIANEEWIEIPTNPQDKDIQWPEEGQEFKALVTKRMICIKKNADGTREMKEIEGSIYRIIAWKELDTEKKNA